MLFTLRVLPTPVGSATPLRAVLHSVVSLRLAHNAPFSSIHVRSIHVRRVRGVGGNDAWVLRLDKELKVGGEVCDWWHMMMAAPPSGDGEAVALVFEVEGETRCAGEMAGGGRGLCRFWGGRRVDHGAERWNVEGGVLQVIEKRWQRRVLGFGDRQHQNHTRLQPPSSHLMQYNLVSKKCKASLNQGAAFRHSPFWLPFFS